MRGLLFDSAKRLPLVLGTEAAECGLACLTMIAKYWGHDVDLNGLRQRFKVSIAGASLRALIEQADALHLGTRALRIELSALPKIKTPAILHWDLSHFVVLHSVNGDKVVVYDPSAGIRRMGLSEFSKHFTGVVLEVTPLPDFSVISAKSPTRLHDLWSEIKGFWSTLVHILALSIALQAVAFAAPFQLQLVVDQAISRNDSDLLVLLALAFGGLVLIQYLIEALREWSLLAIGQMFSYQIVGNLVRHLTRLPVDWFEKRHVGDILSRIGSVKPIEDAITRGAISAFLDGVTGLLAGGILFIYSPLLGTITFLAFLLTTLISAAAFPILRSKQEKQIIAAANEQSYLMESIRAAVTVKTMGGEAQRDGAWRNLFVEKLNASFSVAKLRIWISTSTSIISGLQAVLVIFLASRMILEGSGFSLGMLFAFLSFQATFTQSATAFVQQLIEFRLLGLQLERIGDIVQGVPENFLGQTPTRQIQGAIELKDVSFKYGTGDRSVLESIDLKIKEGEYVAITGPSGSGKSTLCKILLGLYRPTSGEVYLDGEAASPQVWRSWRQEVGLVAQEDRLLSGSIADNISFFDPAFDMDRLQSAAVQARIHDDVLKMPMQYLSLVGDMGSSLSGGQKQRVLLARALYRAPKILILDEGTANLDEETEAQIAALVKSLCITRIVIAHRPALIKNADRVLRIESGRIKSA